MRELQPTDHRLLVTFCYHRLPPSNREGLANCCTSTVPCQRTFLFVTESSSPDIFCHSTSPIRRWISGRAWCDGPIPARARRDAVCCSVRCRQARHRFLRTAGLPLGRKTLAGYQEQGPSLSGHPALVRSAGSVEPALMG